MKKRILSLLLALVMLLGMLPMGAAATEGNQDVVYLSISFDGQYIDDKNGNPIVYRAIPLETIAAVDLTEYGLDNMLFDADGDGNYETTALQMLIYAHEELYGGDWNEVTFNGDPGHSYFAGGIFDFTDNLVYFHNGDFPVDPSLDQSDTMTNGATSEHIVLKAGDFIDVASFSCYNFLWDTLGGFHLFADPSGNYVHDYTATAGEELAVKVKHSFCDLMYGQSWVKDATDYEVYYGKTFGEAEGTVTTDSEGNAEITFPNAGTYYVWCDGDNGYDDGYTHSSCEYYFANGVPCIVSAPAYAKVTVTGGEAPEQPCEHSWVDATCTAPKTCSECGATDGDANGHSWADATCTAPKTCSECGATDGDALGHSWVDATCTAPKTCSVCTATEGEADPNAHAWENHVCSLCSAKHDDLKAAEVVAEMIADIGVVDLEKKAKITAARAAYDALSETQKALVENYDVLTAAEATLDALMAQASADEAAATAVEDFIATIGEVTLAKENAITTARTAYNNLTDAQKALVENLETLEAAEARLDELKAAAEQAAADEAAATAVEALIAEIGDVTLESEEAIVAARTAYNDLTETQKALVENYDVLTDAEAALADLKPQDVSVVLDATLTKLAATVTEPSLGTNYGEWSVFSLARGNYYAKDSEYFADYYTRILYNVETAATAANKNGALDTEKSTDNSRLIFALSSIGIDATKVGKWDLVEAYSANGINWIGKQGLNGTIWALIALDSGDYVTTDTTLRQQCVDKILAAQHNDGGWSLVTNKEMTSNVDITGMALTALYPYREQTSVKTACDAAIEWLSESQLENGGFPYGTGETSESCVWAIVGLTTWGINPDTDPRFVKNGNSAIDNLLTYYLEESAQFEHFRGAGYNAMATDQASYALVAYDRFVKGEKALFDMSDVEKVKSEQQIQEVESVTLDKTELTIAVGEHYDLTATVTPAETVNGTVTWTTSNRDVATVYAPDKGNGRITGKSAGTATITVEVGGKTAACTVTVTAEETPGDGEGGNTTPEPETKTITVTMRLIGAELSTQDVDLGETAYLPNYVTWMPTAVYTLDEGATVYDLWMQATGAAGIGSIGAGNDYVETVWAPAALGGYELSEFTNGARSGWMYTINGSHPGFGLRYQQLHDGDVVIWHYVNDYAWEVEDWSSIGGTSWPQLSTGANNYWNRWLLAPDYVGGAGGGTTSSDKTEDKDKAPESKEESVLQVSVSGNKATVEKIELPVVESGSTGEEKPTGNIVLDFSKSDDAATESAQPITAVAIPTDIVKQIADASGEEQKLEIVLAGGAAIELDAAALSEKAAKEGNGEVNISMESSENAPINDAQKEAVGDRPAYEISVTSGGKNISDMGSTITVRAPYELKPGEKARGLVVWYVDDNGVKHRCTTGYDPIKKCVTWNTDHFSLYMIGYDESLANNPFIDVTDDAYYFDAVLWALDNGITNGTGDTTFSPAASCTRAQMVTFLWRAAGSPKATATACAFTDVDKDAYYYEALLWAVENGITNGTSDTTFSPNAVCSRGQMATFLYRNAKTPAVSGGHAFTDVNADAYYNNAVIWAAEQKITNGTSDTAFSPDADCTRGQMVTFLYRYLAG